MKNLLRLAALAVAVAACEKPAPPPPPAPPPAPAPKPKLTYGLALPWGPDVAIQRARASSAYLGQALGVDVEPKLFNYDELAAALSSGAVDISFMPPLGYVKAATTGKVALLRRARHASSPDYRGVIFVRADSKVSKLEELKGKDVAWVQEGSASGNLFPRAWMYQHGHDPAQLFAQQKQLANHSEVCQAVYTGKAWAGASFTNGAADPSKALVDGCQPSLGDKVSELKILVVSDPIPNDVIAVRAGLDPALTQRIGEVFDHMTDTPEGKTALADGFSSDGFLPAVDADYDGVRKALESLPKPEAAPADAQAK